LTVVAIELPTAHRVLIDTHLRVGARYETNETSGISHFLEHMLYRGTPAHPSAQELALAVESKGGMLLAATATDSGSLTVSSPPGNFAELLALHAQVFQYPVLSGIDVERGIVSQEILEGLDENGRSVDPDNLIRALAFLDHPLGLPITGTLAHLERFDRDMLTAHHGKHYTAQNAVMAIAGPIDIAFALEGVQQHFSNLPQGELARAQAPAPASGPRFSYVKDSGSQTALRVAFRAPGLQSEDEPAVDLILRLIDDGMSTELYRRVCDNLGLCYDVSASYEAYSDSGLFEFRAETTPDRMAAVLREILGIASDLGKRGPSAEALRKAQQRHLWQLYEMLDSPESLTNYFALGTLHQVQRSPIQRQAQLAHFDAPAIAAAASRLFQPQQLSVLAVGTLSRREQEAIAKQVADFR
jgi:predicted Zn-dependent peptidase